MFMSCDDQVIFIQLFKKPHRQRKIVFVPAVMSTTSIATEGSSTSGLESRRLSPFNKNLFQLMPTKDPILSESLMRVYACIEAQNGSMFIWDSVQQNNPSG